MRDDDIHIASLLEGDWLSLEQVAAVCTIEPDWLMHHADEGFFVGVEHEGGSWHFSAVALSRARRMYRLERDFEAAPELAALVADLVEQLEDLRARLRRAGLD